LQLRNELVSLNYIEIKLSGGFVFIDLYVSGDNSVLDLDFAALASDNSFLIHNDPLNPAHTVYLNLPKIESLLEVHSSIRTDSPNLELMILLNSDTYIRSGKLDDFERVMITDQKILERSSNNLILSKIERNDSQLKIDNFKVNSGYLFATQVELLNGGIARNLLGVVLHGHLQNLLLQGVKDSYFTVGNLDVKSHINLLDMNTVLLKGKFSYESIQKLTMQNSKNYESLSLKNVKECNSFSLDSLAHGNEIFTDSIIINRLNTPSGKFYISAKSYIKFNTDKMLSGVDLVLDMSDSTELDKRVLFPSGNFYFERITVIGANSLMIPNSGKCKTLLMQNCDLVNINNFTAGEVKYNFPYKNGIKGKLFYSGHVYNDFLVNGHVEAVFYKLKVRNLEGSGLCQFNFHNATYCEMLKLNLNVDAFAPPNIVYDKDNLLSLRIDNEKQAKVVIEVLLAKLSVFHVKGNATFGEVLIQPIDKIPNLFWIDTKNPQGMKFNRLAILSDCQIVLSPDGTISLIQTKNQLTSGDIYASVSSAKGKEFAYINAGGSIIFQGYLQIDSGDAGLRSRYGNIFINGVVKADNQISLIADHGLVNVKDAVLDAKVVSIYSGTGSHIADTVIKAIQFAAYTLNGFMKIHNVDLRSRNIAIVAEDDISVSNSCFKAHELYMQSGASTVISESSIIAESMFTDSIRDFLMVNSNINLLQHNNVLFGDVAVDGIIQGGFRVAKDIQVVGIFGKNRNIMLADIEWQRIDFRKEAPMSQGSAYIDACNGYIIGSELHASDSVIIRTSKAIDVVPLILHNELLDAGGYNKSGVKEIVSRINAGIIDIKAGDCALFVGALLRAATGKVDADVIYALDSPDKIEAQQERIRELGHFKNNPLSNPLMGEMTIGESFNFSKATSLASRISNLGIYNDYKSLDLYFTQKQGDITLDKSINKYEKLHVTAEGGKILITSLGLQSIYQGHSGGNTSYKELHDARTVIAGSEVYLIADEVKIEASRFNVTGDLKIVAKDGVYILPVSVHQSLMHHKGSKTAISEHEVRLVVTEINAGYLDIKAGGALTAVSTLINATGVNLNVGELNLLSEREVFEKRITFIGTEKWHGGYSESMDYFKDEFVVPTIIKTGSMHANVNGNTTIEAARILVEHESIIRSEGDLNILAKYDVHLHDHTSSKSYLFDFHGGKLSIAGTKTIKEHFYGEAPMPTIYYSKGEFYGYSAGKVHLLGAKIIGNDIYLVGAKGIKIEAAPFSEEKVVSFTQEGFRLGFTSGGGNHSVDAEFFKEEDKKLFKRTFYEVSELIARNSLTLESPETIEIISSKFQFTKASIKARGLHIHTHADTIQQSHQHSSLVSGLHFGVQEKVSSTVGKVGHILTKTGTHWLDLLDRGLNAYESIGDIKNIYQDIEQLVKSDTLISQQDHNKGGLTNLSSVKYGTWLGASMTHFHSQTMQSKAIDNEFNGGDIDIDISEDAVIKGIKCNVDNFTLKAKKLELQTSHDTTESETYTANIDITVPINGNIGTGISSGFSKGEFNSTNYHRDNIINVAGKLVLNIEQDAIVRGVRFVADNVDINADSLIIESLQDTLKERMQGMDLSFGLSSDNTQSFGAKAKMMNKDKVWTEAIASIIGREVVNIAVQQTLEIVGGLIANAEISEDGTLTEKGRAFIQAGKIITRQLHDFDNGHSYGVGINLSKGVDDKGNIKYGVKAPVTYSFNEKTRDLLPTIGEGGIYLSNSDRIYGVINQAIKEHIANESSESGSLDASLPISDLWNAIKPYSGLNAGDDLLEKDLVLNQDKALAEGSMEEMEHELVELELAPHEELLNINPEVGDGKTNYVIKAHYRTISLEVDQKTGEVRETLSPGHFYYEKIYLPTKENEFCGLNPKSFVGKVGMEQHERDEHNLIIDYMKKTGKQVLYTKVFYGTKEQSDQFSKFANILKDDWFFIGVKDCSDVADKLFKQLNMPTAHKHLFKSEELLLKSAGIKMQYSYGHRDAKLKVQGNSPEEIASKYNISIDRVEKTYQITDEDKTLQTKDFHSHVAIERVILNILKDKEYLILPPNGK